MASTEVNNVDHRAPDVRHLVYSMYRKMLTGYNDQANEIVDALPREMVQEDADIYKHLQEALKQQSNPTSPAGDGHQGVQPTPPPPPSFPGALPGRRLKTEIPERGLEPPSVIQNAMMTKDKKPFTYTPGGIDLSEIRSPKMQRRINRNACADEMPGMPAPTNQGPAVAPPGNSHFAAMQSQLPAQVLPQGAVPPPPPPPPASGANSESSAAPPPAPSVPSAAPPKPMGGRPPLGFDPNELLARVNKTPAYEPTVNREEPVRNFKPQPVEEKPTYEPKHPQKSNEVTQNVFVPHQNEPGHIYVPPVTPKAKSETTPPVATSHSGRGQLGSLYVPPVATVTQEQSTPSPTSPYGSRIQQSPAPVTPAAETKPQAPWMTAQRTPQPSVPWANREPETPKPTTTRIIPIQVEGRGDSPKPASPSPQPQSQPTPPPFLQSPQMRQQPVQQQQSFRQQPAAQQQQGFRQAPTQPQQQSSNTRVIPIQIEGSSQSATGPQPRSPGQGFNQNKFNPMAPMSPTPYSPSQEKEVKPQWAPVQPRPFKKEPEGNVRAQQVNESVRNQQPQPEYGTYNTAGVPLSQLRKMQLSDDDRALMDKFKSQVERQGNDILSDENCNPRYRGGYIPSRVFKMLDESVDDENYLHKESDPRYRGAAIPSRAFRILQSMTDTAGDMPQQVPRSPSRGPASRPVSGAQFQPEIPQGPYVPPSEQQVQEPKKYVGGSIPSRSFRMLQAMTGQEVSASNPSRPPSGRETPVSGINRWCPSPSPSPIDPFYGYYPPDPYYIYNYISDLNVAYGFPPPPPPLPFHPYHYQMYPNYSSDNDEQGYSSTDELAQYYGNYRKNFGYSPYQPNPERRSSTPNPFKLPRVCITPVPGSKKLDQFEKANKVNRTKEEEYLERVLKKPEMNYFQNRNAREEVIEYEQTCSSEDDDSETETEVEEESEEKIQTENRHTLGVLQTLKSVCNVNVYSENISVTEQKHYQEVELEEEEISSAESFEEMEPEEKVPHQLSVIFEESELSDVESMKRLENGRSCLGVISESESCSTLDNGEDDSDNDILDAESSVTVRLPLKLKFSRTDNDEDVTTVIVGDSEVQSNTLYNLNPFKDSDKIDEPNSYESDEADISVTFTIPTRSNSIISIDSTEKSTEEGQKSETIQQPGKVEEILEEPEVEAEITVCLPFSKSEGQEKREEELEAESEDEKKGEAESEDEEKEKEESEDEKKEEEQVKPSTSKTENCESPHLDDDSSSTSVQSGDTILKQTEDTDEETQDEVEEEKPKPESFKSWMEKEIRKDWIENDKTAQMTKKEETKSEDISYEAGVEKLEEIISSMLQTARDKMSSSMELSQNELETPCKSLKKKDSQEESEEDDSGVTSDVSIKQVNSETDADTESDYSELSKMTKFQRASTHSRLFKLLQEECENCGNEDEVEETKPKEKIQDETDTLTLRKQKLTLPLNPTVLSEVESLSSSSGIASPSSPTVNDRLVKELIHSLLNKKKGKKFRKLPLAKLHAAALKILQEEMDPYDTSPTSGDDSLLLSPIQRKNLHSKLTAKFVEPDDQQYLEQLPESIYGENYYNYLDYYNTWGNPEMYYPEDYDIVPSRAFRMLSSPKPVEGFKARCPRVLSKKDVAEPAPGRKTPAAPQQAAADAFEYQNLSFAEKQEKVSKVLEKSIKS